MTTAMSFKALSTRSPAFIAAQKSDMALLGFLSINCVLRTEHTKITQPKIHPKPVSKKWRQWLILKEKTQMNIEYQTTEIKSQSTN
jgi:hypothetical protein